MLCLKKMLRNRLWESWPCMGFLLIISITIVGILFGGKKLQGKSNVIRHKRSLITDACLKKYGGIELNYTKGSTTSFTFDLCSVIKCGGRNSSWRGYDVYLCQLGYPGKQRWCPTWDHVLQATNRDFQGSTDKVTRDGKVKMAGYLKIQRDFSSTQNPITMSILGLKQDLYKSKPTGIPNQCWGNEQGQFYLLLGVDVTGSDPLGLVKINLREPQVTNVNVTKLAVRDPKEMIVGEDYTKLTPEDIIEKATGYGETNLWLEWLINTAKEQKIDDCVACAGARPRLHIEPAPLHPNDTWGYNCMLSLTREVGSTNCTTLASIFPPISNDTRTGPFVPRQNNYTCFNFTPSSASINYGRINEEWCTVIIKDNGTIIGPWARAGLYYYCGDRRLFTRVPPNTKGLCAMVRLGAPLTLIGGRVVEMKEGTTGQLTSRRRRHVIRRRAAGIDLSLNSPTYIDIIGVPRGVPDEYKLADQVAAGFENIPIIAALFPITPNKNVDRINYVHYNVMRLANLSRDAVQGLSEQLAPTSLMAVQNRLALDMLLAEKGGVCHMFGDLCCTFIPNNTAPDGSVTKALEGLRVLSIEMKEHSGVDNPIGEWLDRALGKWKPIILSILASIAVFISVLVTCGCCCVPCIRSLCNRLIVAAIEKKDTTPPPYSMPLLSTYQDPESEDDDDEEHQV